ncbi:MAG: PepSY domain-containing protein [Pseudomonadales bacterium]|nr:PepSY domain-containing protein [Pseudomonadales bacterium]MCP5330041.1 PepSY domain-containing protein [Pseudomonadales bacterium]MCP5343050.1 PepSY domain-containing protein [Pseudomonadales bacterium]
MFRKTIFWMHLICGVLAGLVVLMMSVTGVILTYERQLLAWEDHAYYAEPEPGQQRLSAEALVAAGTADGEFSPQSLVISADPAAPAMLSAGRSGSRYLNPYTAEIYTPHSESLGAFLSTMRGWHRWFNVSGEGRDTARMITGASNLMFLFLVLSGLYLWLPAVYRWSTMRMRLWFHPNAKSGQARDFNWHHVFGFWAAIPLAVIVATATVFYYPWANNLVYQLAGEEPPVRGRAAPADAVSEPEIPAGAALAPMDELLQTAALQHPAWQTLSINLPAEASAVRTVSIDEGNGGQPQKRHGMTLNAYNGEIVALAPFSSQSTGRQARSWVRFLHTGEALGLIGQTIAGLASFAGVLMVWTGLALAWRRFVAWQRRIRKARATQASGELEAMMD